jgi:Ca2+-binding EF-hand superfamily protein
MFDTDGSGEISAAELGAVAEELGLGMDANDLASAMAEMDGDGSGEVDLAEFGTAAVT